MTPASSIRMNHSGLQRLARLTWLILVGLQVFVFIAGLTTQIPSLKQACTEGLQACREQGRLTPGDLQALLTYGWTVQGYVWYQILSETIAKLLGVVVGFLVFWRKPLDRIAWVASLFLALGIETSLADFLVVINPAWWLPTRILSFVGILCFGLFFCIFPNGRFIPLWTKWMGTVWGILFFLSTFFPDSPLDINSWGLAAAIVLGLILIFFIVAQVSRYLHFATPIERVQTKWVILAISISLVVLLASALLVVIQNDPGVRITRYWLLVDLGFSLQGYLIPLAIGVAILKYHLFDIDVIIRKTLVYGLLTAILGLLYFGLITLLQSLSASVLGRQSPVITVLSTLAIAALFNPLRRRIQDFIDRRFYRKKYDAEKALAQFAEAARNETDMKCLNEALLEVVQETVQPEQVSIWLNKKMTRR